MEPISVSTEYACARNQSAPILEHRLLVVEDDTDLMNVVIRVAENLDSRHRINVDWATDADGALEHIDKQHYSLILVDYFLKGSKSGLTLLGPCRDRQPDSSFAMMSSMAFEDFWGLTAARDIPLLRKPFTAAECAGFLASALP